MITNRRVLVLKDIPRESTGSIILPAHYIKMYTGVVIESRIADIPVGSHVAVKPDTSEIELMGQPYFSASAKDILVVKPNTTEL